LQGCPLYQPLATSRLSTSTASIPSCNFGLLLRSRDGPLNCAVLSIRHAGKQVIQSCATCMLQPLVSHSLSSLITKYFLLLLAVSSIRQFGATRTIYNNCCKAADILQPPRSPQTLRNAKTQKQSQGSDYHASQEDISYVHTAHLLRIYHMRRIFLLQG
jgi:hypothetical protein